MRRIREVTAAEITSRALRPYLSDDDPITRRFLLCDDGVEAGFVEVETAPVPRRFEVTKLVVARRFRGRGIGGRLLTHAERVARREGYSGVHLRAHALDTRAPSTRELEDWYRRRGYLPLLGPSVVRGMRKPL